MTIEEIREGLGEWPVIVPRNHQQFLLICNALQLNPHRTQSALRLRALEGVRPTAIVYGPDWQDVPDWIRISETLDRLMVLRPVTRPSEFHLTREQL